ncbi:hypothetical protein SH668x_002868 [Planctomicrobium sp. SH668]|uniref:hypothetical protein n=1 Tax=Planctomicrobium sp. SH668 TaxID=3448126 RepID=UPI003F5B1E25
MMMGSDNRPASGSDDQTSELQAVLEPSLEPRPRINSVWTLLRFLFGWKMPVNRRDYIVFFGGTLLLY